jgi:hypothetical protein
MFFYYLDQSPHISRSTAQEQKILYQRRKHPVQTYSLSRNEDLTGDCKSGDTAKFFIEATSP